MKAIMGRKIHFSSAHRYYNPNWDTLKNKEVFGKCYSEFGHGHNYMADIYIEGDVDPKTGMVINLRDLDIILKKVMDPIDHHHLNFDVPEFKTEVPTTENIAKYLYEKINVALDAYPCDLFKVRLYETDSLWVDYGKYF